MFYIYDQEPQNAAFNMALDEYLLDLCHREKNTFLRLYLWENPSFSIGVSQKIDKVLDLNFINENKCEYIRRVTGGKAVLHNDELTYSLVSSEDIFFKQNDLYRSYLLISKVLIKALKILGIDASLHKGNDPLLSKSDNPCFSFPTAHEIKINSKKIIGSAQKRSKKALLQHGSIPFTMDYKLYAKGTRSDEKLLRQAMISLNDVLKITKEQLAQVLIKEFGNFLQTDPVEYKLSIDNTQEFKTINQKYQSKDWNFFYR